ncbi:MAG: QacE family quaternary ammonium compound efflux SMR transporter [Zoogloea sp.]|jgi:small multidrug resistance pump|uniref:SMR family transporter n=1 Tax=Zoogloea sp. TaxID=49181 RepID=UPI001AC2DC97|nr:SMR family transporter [Zoogloea sp.]MBN9695037.1 QacE family quaternary ammonium compound efflux SMR transporter [Zoogloea sp.]MCA0184689.1 QacE family quaternary ammonium compound efflux SMR transporter [Pseudomonadota bacterium]MCK6395468.1 SMR family transporter [Zoogloea sp.]
MPYLFLALAIVCEVFATSALKACDGFTRLGPSVLVVIGYVAAFFFLSLALRHVSIGVAYAIWSGAGIVLISLAAWLVYGQRLDVPAMLGMGLIVAGVAVIQLFSRATQA